MAVTAKQVYKNTLIELSKVNAPVLKLYEFNHYFNKAIYSYIVQAYALYDTSQATTDALRPLQSTIYLEPTKVTNSDKAVLNKQNQSKYPTAKGIYNGAYEVWLPTNYFHLLNCICTFERVDEKGCAVEDPYYQVVATRVTADAWPLIINDYYNKPSVKRPYYRIYNHNRELYTDNRLPVDPVSIGGNDIEGQYSGEQEDLATEEKAGSNFKRTFSFTAKSKKMSTVEKEAATRIGNPTEIRVEINCGKDDSKAKLVEVQIDYLKVPQYIRLTQEQLDLTKDTSQILEWSDSVCQEIESRLVLFIMERTNDPRLGTNMQINSTATPSTVAQ